MQSWKLPLKDMRATPWLEASEVPRAPPGYANYKLLVPMDCLLPSVFKGLSYYSDKLNPFFVDHIPCRFFLTLKRVLKNVPAAGAVVNKKVEENSIVGGVPAKLIKNR